MSNPLIAHVHVVGEDGFTPAVFGPDDKDIPAWALDQMGAHCFEDGEHPSESTASAKSAQKAPAKSE